MFFTFVQISGMKKIELLLTRHGETLENQQHILQGQLPGTLSELGIRQAEDLAVRLEGQQIDVILCSDLARSYDTAMAVARRRGMTPLATPLLREMDWGIYTGGTLSEVDWFHLPQSVESVEELYHRAGELIGYIKVRFGGKRVLAVGHGAFNRAIIACIENRPAFDMIELPIMGNTEVKQFFI